MSKQQKINIINNDNKININFKILEMEINELKKKINELTKKLNELEGPLDYL